MNTHANGTPASQTGWNDTPEQGEENLERGLAQFVFMREERDREVRLLFRDVPPAEICLTFRAAGASLISLSGERANVPAQNPGTGADADAEMQVDEHIETEVEEAANGVAEHKHARRESRRSRAKEAPMGELLLRYFFAHGETVYTVNIAVSSGVTGSVAHIYPSAYLSERELQDRLQVIFLGAE